MKKFWTRPSLMPCLPRTHPAKASPCFFIKNNGLIFFSRGGGGRLGGPQIKNKNSCTHLHFPDWGEMHNMWNPILKAIISIRKTILKIWMPEPFFLRGRGGGGGSKYRVSFQIQTLSDMKINGLRFFFWWNALTFHFKVNRKFIWNKDYAAKNLCAWSCIEREIKNAFVSLSPKLNENVSLPVFLIWLCCMVKVVIILWSHLGCVIPRVV